MKSKITGVPHHLSVLLSKGSDLPGHLSGSCMATQGEGRGVRESWTRGEEVRGEENGNFHWIWGQKGKEHVLFYLYNETPLRYSSELFRKD